MNEKKIVTAHLYRKRLGRIDHTTIELEECATTYRFNKRYSVPDIYKKIFRKDELPCVKGRGVLSLEPLPRREFIRLIKQPSLLLIDSLEQQIRREKQLIADIDALPEEITEIAPDEW